MRVGECKEEEDEYVFAVAGEAQGGKPEKYQQVIQVMFEKRVRVFHQAFQTPRNR